MNALASLVATKANTVLLVAIVSLVAGGVAAYVHHAQVEERAREVAAQQELARRQAAQALADKKTADAAIGEKNAAAFFTIPKTPEFRWNDPQFATPTPQPKRP